MNTKRCPKCHHIFWDNEEHECPSPEYEAARDKLVAEAAEAVEMGLVNECGIVKKEKNHE